MLGISDKLHLIGSSFIAMGLRVITTLVMARLIAPEEYGIFLLVIAVPGLIGSFGDICLPHSLVQITDEPERNVIDTAFVMGLAINFFYAVITIGGGYLLADARSDPRLIWVSVIVAVTGVLKIIYTLQLACVNRRMEFGVESVQNIVSSLSLTLTGIGFALLNWGVFEHWGVYAIALQLGVSQLVSNIAIYRREPLHWPSGFRWRMVRRFLSLGGKATIAGYLSGVRSNAISVLIGGVYGDAILGAWGRANSIMQLVSQNVIASFERVIFPILCGAQDDHERLRSLFVRSFGTLMLVSAFLSVWVMATQHDLVQVLLGSQWSAVPPILAMLAFGVPAWVLYSMGHMTNFASARTAWLIAAAVITAVCFFPFLYPSTKWGMNGVTILWVSSQYVLGISTIAGLGFLKLPKRKLLGHTALLFLAAALSGGLMYLLNSQLHGIVHPILNLMLVSGLGFVVYIASLWVLDRDILQFAWAVSRKRTPPAPPQETIAESPLVDGENIQRT